MSETEAPTEDEGEESRYIVPPDLEPLHIDIDLIVEAPTNENDHPPDQIEILSTRFADIGMQTPLNVTALENGKFQTNKGHAQLRAARVLGWTHVPAVRFDGSPLEAEVYRISDNAIGRMSSFNDHRLAETTRRLRDSIADFDPLTLAIDTEELARLDALLATEATSPDPGGTPPDPGTTPDPAPGPGLGTPIIRYEIIFDTEAQQQQWFEFLKEIRTRFPKSETLGERLASFFANREPVEPIAAQEVVPGPVGKELYILKFDDAPTFARFTGMVQWLEKQYEGATLAEKMLQLYNDAVEEKL